MGPSGSGGPMGGTNFFYIYIPIKFSKCSALHYISPGKVVPPPRREEVLVLVPFQSSKGKCKWNWQIDNVVVNVNTWHSIYLRRIYGGTWSCFARAEYYKSTREENSGRLLAVRRGNSLVANAAFASTGECTRELFERMRADDIKAIIVSDELIGHET